MQPSVVVVAEFLGGSRIQETPACPALLLTLWCRGVQNPHDEPTSADAAANIVRPETDHPAYPHSQTHPGPGGC